MTRHDTTRHDTVRYSTVQYPTARHSTPLHRTAQHGTVPHHKALYRSAPHRSRPHCSVSDLFRTVTSPTKPGSFFLLPKCSMLLLTAGVAATRLPLPVYRHQITATRSGYCYKLLPLQTTGSLGKKKKLPVVCSGSKIRTTLTSEPHDDL